MSTMMLTMRNIAPITSTVPTMALRSFRRIAKTPYLAMPRPDEHGLHQEGVAQHHREVEAEDRECRDHRGTERVLESDLILPKGEGTRHFDILTAIDLGHVGAREARRLSHSGQREREGGQDQVLDGIPKGAPLTRNQRIKRVHAADHRRRIEGLAQPSRNREEAENEAQQQHQEDGPHEARCHDAEQRKEPSDIVDCGVAVARGDDAERHAHQHHDQPGRENELQRRREGIDQIQGDGATRDQRFAEIAAREPLDEFPVLDRQRFVQMQAMAQLLDLLRRRH